MDHGIQCMQNPPHLVLHSNKGSEGALGRLLQSVNSAASGGHRGIMWKVHVPYRQPEACV